VITFPNAIVQTMWQNNFTIIIDRNPCQFRNWIDAENTYIYVNYTHSEHEITVIPEFPSIIIVPAFMLATLLLVIVYREKRPKLSKR